MKNNKKIVLIIAIIIILIIGIALVLLKNKYNSINKVSNNTLQSENEKNTETNNTAENTGEILASNFDFKILKLENNNKNMIYSPLSLKYALNMLKDGADGNTKKQIEEVIGSGNISKYNDIDNVLSIANAFYIKNDYKKNIKSDYIKTLSDKYNAEIKYDSFENADNMNEWIKEKTLGQIDEAISPADLSNSTKTVLINALAIDMKWKNQFETEATTGEDFTLENGEILKATTMQKEFKDSSMSYYQGDDATAVSMDLSKYDDTQLEFVAIMPKDNLSDYIKNLDYDKYEKITKSLRSSSRTSDGVDLKIPKFSFDYNIDLDNDLKNMGITDVFDSQKANLTKMANPETNLFVSKALQEAHIDFTEKGVKAAAVTAMITKDSAAIIQKKQPIEIKIDRPFMYVIKDKKTNEIWFVGTVYEPNSWEKDKSEY